MTFPINSSNLTMQQNRFPNNYVTNNYNNYVTMMPSFPIPVPQAYTQNQLTLLPGLPNHAQVTQPCSSNPTMQRNIFQQNHCHLRTSHLSGTSMASSQFPLLPVPMQSHSRSSLTSADLNEMTHLRQQATYQPPTTATNTASLAVVGDQRNGDFLHNFNFYFVSMIMIRRKFVFCFVKCLYF